MVVVTLPSMMMRNQWTMETYASVSVLFGLLRMFLSVTSGVLLIIAIAKLAKPPVAEASTAFAQGRYQ